MAFKQIINGGALLNTFKSKLPLKNSKKLLAFLAVFVLLGTNVLMAQTAATTDAAKPGVNWFSVGYYVLMFILLAVSVAVVGKIIKVYDLSQQIQGKKGVQWNNIMGIICLIFLVVGMIGAYWEFTVQGSMTLPEAASKHGIKIDAMFLTTTIITMIVFVITQILLFVFLFRYRYSDKRRAYFLPHNNTIEKVWTIIPAVVLTILVIFGFFTWQEVENSADVKGQPASINIDITGHQFAWELRYSGPDGILGKKDFRLTAGANKLGIDFKDKNSMDDLQADTLVLPVNKTIRLNIFAQDVIHSVYMPHFRVQQNAVPGLPTFFKFTPTITTEEMRRKVEDPKFEYLLYCNKICGSSHYNMQKVVRVVTEGEYNQWIARQKPYLTPALRTELKLAAADQKKSITQNRLALNN
ncbi:cytochrome c oxidase subunit II [Mucilaginibacter sp. UR6-11]|uniref:cytochrome c oxidase subunit II n=1 Tax=Mucilaginibacter sp. UR6-11 TaxID=1435644 RepID=UPI001E438368|nr:cytochrome c oxidase subunit II [Mucilaginibacter sp. UR6-11]MCC8425177.1 cytochrome c oxidase subunit II [Mucilaginibacter sp. UR6-11]